MQKQAPTPARLAVMVGFAISCFGLLLFLWVAFGGAVPMKPQGYRVEVAFDEATQLAKEADVRISGVPVGRVKAIRTVPEGRTLATIELQAPYAPLPRDARAILRQKTLLGETYIELTPGTKGGQAVPEGGRLASAQVSPTVELDEIVRSFDAPTREAFQTWMQSQAQAVRGRGRDISDALGNLAPFATDTRRLLEVLERQDRGVRGVVSGTGEVFDALSERRGQLSGLIRANERVFSTTAARSRDLQELFRELPRFSRESRTTVERLERFARDTDPLIDQLRPAARELSPTLQEAEQLAPDLKALFRQLGPLVDASRRGLPATEAFLDDLRPALGEFDPWLKQLQPMLNYLGAHKSELTAFFANVVAVTQASEPDASGRQLHYLRTMNPVNPESLAAYPRRLGSNRTNAYMLPRGFDKLGRGGLDSFETRHCGRGGTPRIDPSALAPLGALTDDVADLHGRILEFFYTGEGVAAPACRAQAPFLLREGAFGAPGAKATRFPQVGPAASSTAGP